MCSYFAKVILPPYYLAYVISLQEQPIDRHAGRDAGPIHAAAHKGWVFEVASQERGCCLHLHVRWVQLYIV